MQSPLHQPGHRDVVSIESNDDDSITTQERGNETRASAAPRMDLETMMLTTGAEPTIQPEATHHHFFPVPSMLASRKTETSNDDATHRNNNADKASAVDRASDIAKSIVTASFPLPFTDLRKKEDKKVVGLKDYGISKGLKDARKHEWISCESSSQLNLVSTNFNQASTSIPSWDQNNHPELRMNCDPRETAGSAKPIKKADMPMGSTKRKTVEELEYNARRKALMNPFRLLFLGNVAALKVMGFYLITLETFITCGLTVGLTLYWYNAYVDDSNWNGGSLSFVLLAFAVTSPISAAIGMAFTRREQALIAIADFRAFSYHLFCAHCMWDWPVESEDEMGRERAERLGRVDWLEHCDAVLAQLIGIGDELSRFLTLPTASRSRHRMTKQGRHEAARTMEVTYYLLESMTTQRMTRLMMYSERLKKIGLPSGEISRIRQYERFLSDLLEQLRMVKLYRTPQSLRSFARIFTILLPPFYAPTYAQVAIDLKSIWIGIAFGIITALGLTALFESLQVLEDPFTAFLALDGIDAREEFEVLHFAQLIQTRKLVFPDAPEYPAGRRAALTRWNGQSGARVQIGTPPTQIFHSAATNKFNCASVHSGITMDGTTHVPTVPAGDESTTTVASWIARDVTFDATHAEEELGIVLPPNATTAHRDSIFQEHRLDDDDNNNNEGTGSLGLRHRRSLSRFSLDALAGGASSSSYSAKVKSPSRPTPGSAPPAPTTPPPENTRATTFGSGTPTTSSHHHRRAGTNLSSAGFSNIPYI